MFLFVFFYSLKSYVPSNYVKKEKKSLLDKIIPRRLQAATVVGSSISAPSCISACPESTRIYQNNHNQSGNNQYIVNETPTTPTTTTTTQSNNNNSQQTPGGQNNNSNGKNESTTNFSFIGRAVVKHKYTATKYEISLFHKKKITK